MKRLQIVSVLVALSLTQLITSSEILGVVRAEDQEDTMTREMEEPNVQKSKELELPCGHPGNIDHGLTDWNGTGREAKFACYQGYYLVGPPKLVCR